jgi:hypothetical protein
MKGKLYAVIFDVTVDSAGKIDSLKVAKVIDPGTRSTEAVAVAVPTSFITAARAFLSQRVYATNPKKFNTYLFFDPMRPTQADIDPKDGRP